MINSTLFSPADEYWMLQAIALAKQAALHSEVPVGAVIVADHKLAGSGYNQPITSCDPSAHAEIIALRDAAKSLNNYRLPNTTLYVTVEPCLMCVGAMIHARVKRLVYGTLEPKTGVVASQLHVLDSRQFNHQIEWEGGCLAEQCAEIMQSFFRGKRYFTSPPRGRGEIFYRAYSKR